MFIKYLRLLLAFAHAFYILGFKFPRATPSEKLCHIQKWAQRVLDLLGVHLLAESSEISRPHQPHLLVLNHVSWLDVLVIQALQPSVFVAKSSVRDWPVIGVLAQACRVLFVDRRSRRSAKKMVEEVTATLLQGDHVAAFPEGTSSDGHEVGLFHANLFEAAIRAEASVLPIALRYTHAHSGALCTQAAFVSDMGFLTSLHRVIATPAMNACVCIGNALLPQGHTRRTLAFVSHRSVSAQLARFTPPAAPVNSPGTSVSLAVIASATMETLI